MEDSLKGQKATPGRICKSCREELPQGWLARHCRECFEELVCGVISHEPAKLYSSGRSSGAERHSVVYDGDWAPM